MKNEADRLSLEMRWRPSRYTRDGVLVHYLLDSPTTHFADRIKETVRISWLAIAMSESELIPDEEVLKVANQTIKELEAQIERIRGVILDQALKDSDTEDITFVA